MKKKYSYLHFPVIACIILATGLLTSCDSSKRINSNYIYFRDGKDTVLAPLKETVIQNGDQLSILIHSLTLNQEQTAIFNRPVVAGNPPAAQDYQVTSGGNIEIPVIGNVRAAGLTKKQLEASLLQKLTPYVKNPSVQIRFTQFNINVLGEVRVPGTKLFQADRVTVIDALSAAGDLTDYGQREDITVIRDVNGTKVYHTIDLRKRNVFESPVYVLQPNDIVYVKPNQNKLKNLNVDPEAQRRTVLYLSIVSVAVTVASFILFSLR